jgi:hypothetical protein
MGCLGSDNPRPSALIVAPYRIELYPRVLQTRVQPLTPESRNVSKR